MKPTRKTQHTADRIEATSNLRSSTKKWAALLVAGLSLHGAAACAQSLAVNESGTPRNGGYVGMGASFGPRYQGSDETRTRAIPAIEYHWSTGLFVGGANGLVGVEVNASPQLQLGLALGVDEGRKASRSRYLAGMGNIDVRGTVNIFAKAEITNAFSLSTSVQVGAGDSRKGALLNLSASYGFQLSPNLRMNLNAGMTAANARYMQEYFGIDAEQALAARYQRYSPGAGCRDVTVGLSAMQQVSRDWMLIASLNSTTLANDAKDSPLVRKARSNSTYASLVYSF